MWYEVDYLTSATALQSFLSGVISLFSQTLAALGNVHVFSFFIAAFALAIAFCLFKLISKASKKM